MIFQDFLYIDTMKIYKRGGLIVFDSDIAKEAVPAVMLTATIQANVAMQAGDYVEIWVRNSTNTTSVLVKNLILTLVPIN